MFLSSFNRKPNELRALRRIIFVRDREVDAHADGVAVKRNTVQLFIVAGTFHVSQP